MKGKDKAWTRKQQLIACIKKGNRGAHYNFDQKMPLYYYVYDPSEISVFVTQIYDSAAQISPMYHKRSLAKTDAYIGITRSAIINRLGCNTDNPIYTVLLAKTTFRQ